MVLLLLPSWSWGKILAFGSGDRGSIPGRCQHKLIKVLHPTCLFMHKYVQMAPAINIYTHEYPTTSK